MKVLSRLPWQKLLAVCCVAVLAGVVVAPKPAAAGVIEPVGIQFDTELQELNITGGPFPLPLASDPGNQLADSVEGWGFVNSEVLVTLSSQRGPNPGPASLGEVCAYLMPAKGEGGAGAKQCGFIPGPINPEELDGQELWVDSFFDVFFDITVTDVDSRAARDYMGQPDGSSIILPDVGPADLYSSYTRMFDKDAPSFGLVPPPEEAPYIGHFQLEIPLGVDINGNGENDKIKFTMVQHLVDDENRQFFHLPDGTVVDTFNSAAFIEGAIVDETSDPPFHIGELIDPGTGLPDPNGVPNPDAFGGPTTAVSDLGNPVVPEPSTIMLLAAGFSASLVWRLRRKK